MAMQEAKLLFQPDASAPAMGRRVLESLSDTLTPSALDDARLLLTELLTNAIQHAHLSDNDRISVSVRREPLGVVLVEVSDPGDGLPPPDARPPGSGNGWGFILLDRLADEWGIEPVPDGGTRAWFRLGQRDG
jgi:anti-sigma regulatory factor (Ser/Thr protein kinase)